MSDFSSEIKQKIQEQISAQQQASNPENSVWVFASAGCGKTKILTDRVLRLLLADVAPSKILCLTFTKVAAAQMQERINSQLCQWLIDDENTLKSKLEKLTNHKPSQQLINQARSLLIKNLDSEFGLKIQTIHSFCQSILAIFPFEAGISANFELLTDGQAKKALKEAQQQVFSEAAACNVDGRMNSARSLRTSIENIAKTLSDESLFEMLAKLLSKKEKLLFLQEKFGSSQEITKQLFKIFDLPLEFAESFVAPSAKPAIDFKAAKLGLFKDFFLDFSCEKYRKIATELQNFKSNTCQNFATKLSDFLQNPNLSTLESLTSSLFTKSKIEGEAQINKNLFKASKQFSQNLEELASFLNSFEHRISSLAICFQNSDLLHLVFAILEKYQKFKEENGYLDYSDLILLTIKLLNNPNHRDFVRLKMDGLFDHVLVDESQDTNAQQWQIIRALIEEFFVKQADETRQRSLFVVGDEKQSIYGFQGAEVKTAGQALQQLKQRFQGQNFEQIKEIDLNISFRSKANILKAVDLVFADQTRQKAISQTAKYLPHHSFKGSGGHVEIWKAIFSDPKTDDQSKNNKDFAWNLSELLENKQAFDHELKASKSGEDFSKQQIQQPSHQILAKLIAKKIRSWIETKKQINGRNLEFGDIMILLNNKTNGLSQSLFQQFNIFGIPSTNVNRVKCSESLIIQDFLALARFVLLPQDDFNLACLLKSPFFNVSEDELFEFCQLKNQQQISLFAAVATLNQKIGEKLGQIQELAKNCNCLEFYYQLLFEPQNRLNLALRMGKRVENLIDNFVFLVADFCNKSMGVQSIRGELQSLVDFIEQTDPEFDSGFAFENAVHITTIHSAKGLQAPIVIMPDCLQDLSRSLSHTENLIWLENLPLLVSSDLKDNFLISELRKQRFKEICEESLRLLYVGMTRAEEEIYFGGFGKKNQREAKNGDFKENENSQGNTKTWYEILQNSLNGFANEVDLAQELENYDQDQNFLQNNQSNCGLISDCILEKTDKNLAKKNPDFQQNTDLSKPLISSNRSKKTQLKNFAAADFGSKLHQGLEMLVSFAARFYLNEPTKSSKEIIFLKTSEKFFSDLINNFASSQSLNSEAVNDLKALLTNFYHSPILPVIFVGALQVKCETEIASSKGFKRIDLLVEKEKEVWIIDYKSDESMKGEFLRHYKQQLQNYCQIAAQTYPTKKIRAALLWLRFTKLEWMN